MLEQADLDYLRNLSVFAGLREDVLTTIGKLGRRADFPSDQVVYREGEPAREMAVVVRGTLEVVKRGVGGGEAIIATLGPGAVAGEMSLIDIQPRSADIRCVGPTSLVVLTHVDIAKVYREDNASYTLLLLNIAREISLRLRRTDAALANIIVEIEQVTRRN